jgi:YggT family protein
MLAEIISTAVYVMTILIVIRALLSWVPNLIDPRGPIAEFLYTVTEPILAPIRSLMPRMMFDLSPLIAIFLLQAIGRVLAQSV